jgi:hypothetical protein
LMIASIFFILLSGAVRPWRGKNTRNGFHYASGGPPTLSHSFQADVIG